MKSVVRICFFPARALPTLCQWGLLTTVAIALLPAASPGADRASSPASQRDAKRQALLDAKRQKLIDELRGMGVHVNDYQSYTDRSTMGGVEPGKLSIGMPGSKESIAPLALLERLHGVAELHLFRKKEPEAGGLTDTGFYAISHLKDLQHLYLSNITLPQSALEKLGSLRKLNRITIIQCQGVNDETLRQLKHCAGVRDLEIDVRGAAVTANGFAQLASDPSLRALMVYGATDEHLKQIAQSKSIERLELLGPEFSNDGLQPIGGMKRLKFLQLIDSVVAADGLRHLQPAKELTGLSLVSCPKVDYDSLTAVGELTNLEALELKSMPTTDAELANLNNLSKLKGLYLEDCRLSGAGLASLTRLRELVFLTIQGEEVANETFTHLHNFPTLCQLRIGAGKKTDHPRITDEGLKLIDKPPAPPNRLWISFKGASITEQGLEIMRAIPRVKASFQWNIGVNLQNFDPKDGT